jgi:hypothetical protein
VRPRQHGQGLTPVTALARAVVRIPLIVNAQIG